MPINFPQLLQESWNFIRNQRTFTLFGIGLLFLFQLTVVYSLPKFTLSHQELSNASPEVLSQILLSQILPSLILSLINVFISILLILNIKSINNGTFQHFFQNLFAALKAFFPVVMLGIIMAIPLSIGIAFGGTVGQSGGLAIILLPLMATGIYVFVKLCLSIYAYLIDNPKSIFDTITFTWGLSRGKMGVLFLFCVISYIFPNLLSSLIGQLDGHIGLILSQLVSAFLNLFFVVFGFRFYQLYRKQ